MKERSEDKSEVLGLKVTREEIESIRGLRVERDIYHRKYCKEVKDCYQHDSVTGSRLTVPFDKHSIPVKGYHPVDRKRIDHYKSIYEGKKAEIARIEGLIEQIPCASTRAAVRLVYLEHGYTWDMAAAKLGYGSGDALRMKVQRNLS